MTVLLTTRFLHYAVLLLVVVLSWGLAKPASACRIEVESLEVTNCANVIEYLVYGNSAEPLQIIQPDGLVSGYISDVISEVFSGSKLSIVPVIKPIIRHRIAMKNGKTKRWISYGLNSWRQQEQWKNAVFADVELLPYTLSLGYKDSEQWPPASEQIDLTELAEEGVAWIQGYKYPGVEAFKQRYQFQFDRAKSQAAMVRMVEAGRVKYFMEHAPRMKYAMKKQGSDPDRYRFYSLTEEITPTSITLLMSRDLGADIIAFINQRLQAMADSGRLKVLAKPYGL
jgi:hypothetical protein